jgi:hypothetical protein
MEWKHRLAHNLSAEAQAYGYTLTIWGAGAILIGVYGIPDPPSIFLFVGGALLGYGALAALAFDSLLGSREQQDDTTLVVASAVHVVATVGNLALSYAVVVLASRTGVPDPGAFALVGAQATSTYNVLLLLEDYLVQVAPWSAPEPGGETDEQD